MREKGSWTVCGVQAEATDIDGTVPVVRRRERVGAPEKEGCPRFRWRVRADVGH